MDQRTRKLMALHKEDYIDRLYVQRKEGRRELDIIEDGVDTSIKKNRMTNYSGVTDKPNKNNWETKMGRKITVWLLPATNW